MRIYSVPKYFCPKWTGATGLISVERMVIRGWAEVIEFAPIKIFYNSFLQFGLQNLQFKPYKTLFKEVSPSKDSAGLENEPFSGVKGYSWHLAQSAHKIEKILRFQTTCWLADVMSLQEKIKPITFKDKNKFDICSYPVAWWTKWEGLSFHPLHHNHVKLRSLLKQYFLSLKQKEANKILKINNIKNIK